MIFALFFILVGVLFLMRNAGLLPEPAWSILWPLLLIVFGSALFFQGEKKHRTVCWPWCDCGTNGNGKKRV